MKGIILAGGKGTRLYPTTISVSKQLLPIYDKPMIYYPLSVLMLAGIKDILIISTPHDIDNYRLLLGDGSDWGVGFTYVVQEQPRGLAEAFTLGEEFIGNDSVCLALGDNIFFGKGFINHLERAKTEAEIRGAAVFGYPVANPEEFGVAVIDDKGEITEIEEKPKTPRSNLAVPGLYFYDNSVIEISKKIKPSPRGELEITAVNMEYLKTGRLSLIQLGRGIAWLDTGSPKGMPKASEFVQALQDMQGLYISAPEEVAWRMGFISSEQLERLGERLAQTDYGKYLISLVK